MSEKDSPLSALDIALGAVEVPVTYRTGATGSVLVQLHDIDTYPDYLAAVGNHKTLAEFAAKQPAGWAASLQPASLQDVVDKSLELNFPSVQRWAASRTQVAKLLNELNRPAPSS